MTKRPRTHLGSSSLRRLALAAAATMLLVAAPAAHAADASVGFGASPLKFDVELAPGSAATYTVTITNTDSASTRFTFDKEDFEGDKDEPAATPVLLGGKFASDISAYDWLRTPDPVVIPAGQSRTVPVRVAAPADAKGGHYVALIVNGATRTTNGVTARSRLGVLFMLNAGGVPPPDIVITEVREVGPTRTVTRIRYVNEGQVATRPKPVVTVRDPLTGKPIRTVTGTCSTALPGGSGECRVDESAPSGTTSGSTRGSSPGVTPGTTAGDASGRGTGSSGGGFTSGATQKSVDLIGDGEGSSARAELPAEWAGAWASMLLPLVGVTLFVLYFLFLRRRREAEDELDAELVAGATP